MQMSFERRRVVALAAAVGSTSGMSGLLRGHHAARLVWCGVELALVLTVVVLFVRLCKSKRRMTKVMRDC